MLEVIFDRVVVTPGDAVFGDGVLGVGAGFGDGLVELDGGFAGGHLAVLLPAGDDTALALLDVVLGGGGVRPGLAFGAQGVGVVTGAGFFAANA